MKKSEGFCYLHAEIESPHKCEEYCSWDVLCVTIRDLQARVSQLEADGEK